MKIVAKSRLFRLPLLRNYSAIVLGSYCFLKEQDPSDRLIGHELVHIEQWQRIGIFRFYASYLLQYVWNLLRFRNHDNAYREISFEREAYEREYDPDIQKRVREIKCKRLDP